jgi:Family of unknown function (DUF6481)
MSGFKKPGFVERQNTAPKAKKAALEKFRANAADPAFAERQTARTVSANTRKAAKCAYSRSRRWQVFTYTDVR